MLRPCLAVLILISAAPVFSEVPVTGREQHMVFPRGPVQSAAAEAYHHELSRQSAQGMLDSNPQTLKRIRHICSLLIAQAIHLKPAATNWPWEVHITSDPQVAAYSMGGGKLLVSTHFIESYKLSDNELAVALAHEIGHVIAEHVREQISLAARFNKSVPLHARKVSDVISAMESDISVFLRLQPLSRLQEMEADDIGIELAARAGIPPSAVISFYSKLAESDGGQSVFDTHGPSAQRVKFADSMASYAKPIYEASRNANLSPGYAFADSRR
jgi:Zn-dependent protease with chaperone function